VEIPASPQSHPGSSPQRVRFLTRDGIGERAGQKVRRIGLGFGYEGDPPQLMGPRCASLGGFSLHANTQSRAHRRDQLERLMRYTAIIQESVITCILRHRKLASVPPPIGPARVRQATGDWVTSAHAVTRGLRGDVRTVEGGLHL
jgi:hypothetical protein